MRTILAAVFTLCTIGMAAAENPQKQYVDNYVLVATALLDIKPDEPIGDHYCVHDGFCEVSFDDFKIHAQFHGPYQSNVLTSSQITPEQYLLACAALLSGVAEMNNDKAISTIIEAFKYASSNGSAEYTSGNAKLTVKPGLDNDLECQMFRKN